MTSYNTATLSIKQKARREQEYQPSTTILGNYEIIRKSIGKGSFSKIYKGRCLKTQKKVAIKIIKKRNINNENNVLREIQVMKMIKHENVIKLIDVLASDNKYYLILEFCSNGDLKKHTKHKNISENTLREYMSQIRDGLYELYTKNIIHRDLKPHNILVTENNKLKISDFGFAKSYNPDENLKQTMCGSPIYMAPEILQGKKYDISADLWSFGVIMYELFYNKVPISGYDIGDLVTNVSKFKYIPGSDKEISNECDDLLRQLLKKNPKERIQWEKFIEHPWFLNVPSSITDKSKMNGVNTTDTNNINETIDIYGQDQNENNELSNSLLFTMDDVPIYKGEDELNEQKYKNNIPNIKTTVSQTDIDLDETVLFRSDVNINKYYRRPSPSDSRFIESEFYDDNYVIITSPSEIDIYSRPHLKSYDPNDVRENESYSEAKRTAQYVKLKRVFNSLKESISSYIFRPKSI
jgi:serine/threonine protein kinase